MGELILGDVALPDFRRGRPEAPSIIVIHYTAGPTLRSAEAGMRAAKVSAHVSLDRDGAGCRHVADADTAYHAGSSTWAGKRDINGVSLGVELVNFGYVDSHAHASDKQRAKYVQEAGPLTDTVYWRAEQPSIGTRSDCKPWAHEQRTAMKKYLWAVFPDAQVNAVAQLAAAWANTYNIVPENIVGHEHVSPGRKMDPGPLFPWNAGFYERLLPLLKAELRDEALHVAERARGLQSHLRRLGYSVDVDGVVGKQTLLAWSEECPGIAYPGTLRACMTLIDRRV